MSKGSRQKNMTSTIYFCPINLSKQSSLTTQHGGLKQFLIGLL